MRSFLSFVLVVLTTAILRGEEPAGRAEAKLADIIKRIEEHEKLYQNIEVVMNTKYDIGDRIPSDGATDSGTFQEVIRKQARTRFVSQGDWFRLERKGTSATSQRIKNRDRIRSFDGETTRVLEQNAVGNLSPERLEDSEFIRPHLLVIRHSGTAVPFSVYLSGHDAIRAHPKGNLDQGLSMRVTYEGEETVNDLKCQKVFVDVLLKSGNPHDGGRYYLAEDRNYLPIKRVAYTYRFSKTMPIGQSVVHKLEEIAPGVWFPFDVETTSYNPFKIQREGKNELQWRERHIVESAKLNPEYDRAFFTKVDFPEGTAMYEVVKGEIKKSWRHGAPGTPKSP